MPRDLIIAGGRGAWAVAVLAVVAASALPGAAARRPARLPEEGPPRPAAKPVAGLAQAIAEDAPLPVGLSSASATDPPPVALRVQVIDGRMEDVLYGGGPRARASARIVRQAISLFAHKLDLTRDIALGDRVRLVLRRPSGGGRGEEILDYAELDGSAGPVRLYRRVDGDSFAAGDFVDEGGVDLRRLLLRTPLASLRITSAFGLRLHPLLGYSRMHQGVDFAAPVGEPVLAAGDGVVAAARWNGGYGQMIRLDHGSGLETLYAHLSRWAPGLAPGAPVRQGQVIGWTGATGLATGPHLHFEVLQAGRAIDPVGARLPATPADSAQRQVFEQRKRMIDALLAASGRD